MERPHRNCYWLDPGNVLAGEYPGHPNPEVASRRIESVIDSGIRTFIDLTTRWDGLPPYGETIARLDRDVRRISKPIPDMNIPESTSYMGEILDAIDAETSAGRPVYLHCWGGIGRTGTVAGCYLVRHGMSGPEALEELQRLWRSVEKRSIFPEIPQTEEQKEYVRDWDESR